MNEEMEAMVNNVHCAIIGSPEEAETKSILIEWARDAASESGTLHHQLPGGVISQIDEIFHGYDGRFSGDLTELPKFILERWDR